MYMDDITYFTGWQIKDYQIKDYQKKEPKNARHCTDFEADLWPETGDIFLLALNKLLFHNDCHRTRANIHWTPSVSLALYNNIAPQGHMYKKSDFSIFVLLNLIC